MYSQPKVGYSIHPHKTVISILLYNFFLKQVERSACVNQPLAIKHEVAGMPISKSQQITHLSTRIIQIRNNCNIEHFWGINASQRESRFEREKAHMGHVNMLSQSSWDDICSPQLHHLLLEIK